MAEELVLRILRQRFGRDLRRLPIGGTRHDQAVHGLHRPVLLQEFNRQPIEQFGMRRGRSLITEIFGRPHDSPAEK